MKAKISVSLEENLLKELDKYAKQGLFRNKSHVVEFALNKFLKENKNE
jgi:metal-responsive CopG/Arc/MetJ family transcriptional regulator